MFLAQIVLIGWIPVCAMFFCVMRPLRAVTVAYLGGWLLLPMINIPVLGFWDIDKVLATNAGVLCGMVLFCRGWIRGYRPHVADVLLLLYCASGFASSLSNGLGAYDGASHSSLLFMTYAAPYFAGRVLIRTRADLYEVVRTIVGAAAIYALPAIWEWRMSPQFHKTLYGGFQHSWAQHFRWGFWRPIVFFPHALGLGTFFAWTSLLGIWIQLNGKGRRTLGIPPGVIVVLPLIGLLTSMSLGPWVLFLIGLGLLLCWRWLNFKWVVLVPAVLSLFWMVGRYTSLVDGKRLVSQVALLSQARAASLGYRVDAETLLIARAKQRPLLGWGGWGRNRIRDDRGRDIVATDSTWILVLGTTGLFGTASFFLWWCWPILMSVGVRGPTLRDPVLMGVLMVLGVQAISFLFNGFLSPILTVVCGCAVTILRGPSVVAENGDRQGAARLLSTSISAPS